MKGWAFYIRFVVYALILAGAWWIVFGGGNPVDIADDLPGPLSVLDPAQIARGEAAYERACAACHGAEARAGAGQVDLGTGTSDRAAFYEVVLAGRGAMPAQSGIVTRQEVEDIYWYLEVVRAR